MTAAEQALRDAQAGLAAATLTAPIAGTVASVGLTEGAVAGAGAVVIVGTGAVEVTVDVPLASLRGSWPVSRPGSPHRERPRRRRHGSIGQPAAHVHLRRGGR